MLYASLALHGFHRLLLLFSAISGMLGIFLMPVKIPAALPESQGEDIDFSKTGDSKPEDLPDSDREKIVWNMIWYAVVPRLLPMSLERSARNGHLPCQRWRCLP